LWQTRHEPDSLAKQLHAGHAAQVGVQSALLSAQGFQGPRRILEGEQGFFAAMCPGADPQGILAEYGDGWLLHQTSLKPYPACRHAHAAIDAALLARAAIGEAPIKRVQVETYGDAIKFCDRPDPRSVIEAKFSLQHAVAVTLTKPDSSPPSLSDFELEVINHSHIKDLRETVEVKQGAGFEAAYPSHYGASVTVNGQRFVAKDCWGDPEKPMERDDVMRKAAGLMQHGGMSALDADRLVDNALSNVEGLALHAFLERLP